MTDLPDVDLSNLERNDDETLVSAIVPTFGDADLLSPGLQSIANQTYGNVEIIIVDSSGVGWLEDLAADTEGIVYVYQEPKGLAAARNRGIEAASGEVIAFLDADDRWYPEKLERQMAEMDAGGADVVYSDVCVLTDDGERRRLSALPISDPDNHHIEFLYKGGVPILSVVVRRECFEQNRFNEDLPAVEDRNLLTQLFAVFEPARVAEPLAVYRQRQGSMSSDAATMYEAEMISLEHLADEFPSVANCYEDLVALAEYKYGKRLLRSGSPGEARRHFITATLAGHRDYRLAVLLAISILPVDHRRSLWHLERVQEYLS
ncbi:glycosyltransferase [Halorarum halophilum]|uniref:Glycosyltransferase n=1 Tax=Halorarum halophilum TaxID=2743090 RepID=A0A7D5K5M8_9EURY|nr:glycosyltransferase [Halobaculum halophilum]QLG26094.1 glycosyltransferase [Halobaculum halophilum]